ncbi:putative DNA-binding domain-containing protein [Methylibium sp.]|uniref:HvfC/BufC family peptide modification chaperone n=1 Tax=Methylibium sp. TaxID=2067992 RepID=UPI003D129D7F
MSAPALTGQPLSDQQLRLRVAIVGDEAAAAAVSGGLLRPRAGGSLLNIYRHAYRARLKAALRENHGRLPQVMGDEAFDALAEAYVAEHPSRHPSIRWFGEHLAAFMETRPELAPHPSLPDLARLEWALRTAFDAGDASPLRAEALQTLAAQDWPALRFTPLPSAQLVALRWAIEPLWRALQAHDPHAADEPELPEPEPHDHLLLVWRPQLETRWRSLDALEAALLRSVFALEPFAALCETAAAQVGETDAATAVIAALQGWLAEGLLAAVHT